MFATIVRTNAAQIARDGRIFLNRGNYGAMTADAVRTHCRDWAISEGVIDPQVVVTESFDEAVHLGQLDPADELHTVLLSFSL